MVYATCCSRSKTTGGRERPERERRSNLRSKNRQRKVYLLSSLVVLASYECHGSSFRCNLVTLLPDGSISHHPQATQAVLEIPGLDSPENIVQADMLGNILVISVRGQSSSLYVLDWKTGEVLLVSGSLSSPAQRSSVIEHDSCRPILDLCPLTGREPAPDRLSS